MSNDTPRGQVTSVPVATGGRAGCPFPWWSESELVVSARRRLRLGKPLLAGVHGSTHNTGVHTEIVTESHWPERQPRSRARSGRARALLRVSDGAIALQHPSRICVAPVHLSRTGSGVTAAGIAAPSHAPAAPSECRPAGPIRSSREGCGRGRCSAAQITGTPTGGGSSDISSS
jgi:hypothetical protein